MGFYGYKVVFTVVRLCGYEVLRYYLYVYSLLRFVMFYSYGLYGLQFF